MKLTFVRMRPKGIDSFVDGHKVIEEESAIWNLLKRKEGEMNCPINYKRTVEGI